MTTVIVAIIQRIKLDWLKIFLKRNLNRGTSFISNDVFYSILVYLSEVQNSENIFSNPQLLTEINY